MNYYNEFDPKAAHWLRSLIAAGLIPQGYVDERSIKEVQPSDLQGFRQCHFFCGIGGWLRAFELAGLSAAENVWTGSCPCQSYSDAGNRKGNDDERNLWLRQRFDSAGSMEYVETWKEKATPAGMPYWEHTASGRRTSDSDCSGWPTAAVQNADGGPNPKGNVGEHFTLQTAATMAGWPTATQTDAIKGGQVSPRPGMMGLSETVVMTNPPWKYQGRHPFNIKPVAGWVSPNVQSPQSARGTGQCPIKRKAQGHQVNLKDQVLLAPWATPTVQDSENTAGASQFSRNSHPLKLQATLASGLTSTSSPAETGKPGVLNPVFVAWLMGYPEEWLSCVDWETRLSRK